MSLAPKFKQWVDNLTEVKGIIDCYTCYDIQIDDNKKIEVDIYVKGKDLQGNDLISKVAIYTSLKVYSESGVRSLSLDKDHEDYLNEKLTTLMQQKSLQTWINLMKAKKRSDYLDEIDSFF